MVDGKFRETVVAVIISRDKKVLMCEHPWIDGAWQFPQGGIEENEEYSQTLLRELNEELGSKNFKIIKRMDECLEYIVPYYLRRKYNLEGLSLIFFLVLFTGKDCEICFTNQEKPEFKNFKWVSWETPPLVVVYFKKIPYFRALNFFKETYEKFNVDEFLEKEK